MAGQETHRVIIGRRAEIAGSFILATSAVVAWGCAEGKAKSGSSGPPEYVDEISQAMAVLPQETTAVPGNKSDEAPEGTTKGELAPDPGLKDVNGQEVKLENYRGKVVLLFNYFRRFGASDKGLDQLLQIKAISQYQNEVEILTLVESTDLGRDLLSKTSPVLIIGDKQSDIDKLYQMYLLQGYPFTVLIDKNGILVDTQIGQIDDDFRNRIRAEISK